MTMKLNNNISLPKMKTKLKISLKKYLIPVLFKVTKR